MELCRCYCVISLLVIFVEANLNILDKQYVGCYKDNKTHRVMSIRNDGKGEKIETCVKYCRQQQQTTFAGLEHGNECFCGNVYNTYGPSLRCYNEGLIVCTEQTDTVCGGGQALSVYRVCPIGFYGTDCSMSCGNCAGSGCDMEGKCLNECLAGKYGPGCQDDCPSGKFGPSCTIDCSQSCKDGACDPRTGYCTEGCSQGPYSGPFCAHSNSGCQPESFKPTGPCPFCSHCKGSECAGDGEECYKQCPENWKGTYCKECTVGKWGGRCDNTCPSNCQYSSCIQNNGTCNGCMDGYTGAACDKNCSSNCVSCNQFESDNGNCSKGCVNGSYGEYCNITCATQCSSCEQGTGICDSCEEGYYGSHCNLTCGRCINETCTKDSGFCAECESGYHGDKCDKLCPENCLNETCAQSDGSCDHGCDTGHYSPYCNYSCPDGCLNECDQQTGECDKGCDPGFHLPYCNESCPDGCPDQCDQTGECIYGCQSGYHGIMCDDTCPINCSNGCYQTNGTCTSCRDRYWGVKCTQPCHTNCASCKQDSGECSGECNDGYYGANCTETCYEECFKQKCDKTNGTCTHGCNSGFKGTNCTEVCNADDCENCGCSENVHCDVGTGKCSEQCADGWTGPKCSVPTSAIDNYISTTGANIVTEITTTPSNPPTIIIAVTLGITVLLAAIGTSILLIIAYKRKTKPGNDAASDDNESGQDNLIPYMSDNIASVTHEEVELEQKSNSDGKHQNQQNVANGHTAIVETDDVTEILTKPSVQVKPAVQIDPAVSDMYEDTRCMVRIPVKKMKQHITKLQQNNGFQKEYKRLLTDNCFPWEMAVKKENKPKNRYKGIMAYDHSRVILDLEKGDPYSDYINANYVSSYRRSKAFIASQGPYDKMVTDFWRMIWQLKVTIVVMTTNVYEDEKMKCVQYWPGDGNVVFGDISVTMEEENTQRHHAVRKLKFMKDDEERTLTHFHFTSWPDHGVPDSYSPLINFWHLVRSHTSQMKQVPVLVHCSAGIGRSGTFIALDYLLDQAMEEQHVDVPACVNTLRQYRVNMVQNILQYQFLYSAVYHGIYVGRTLVLDTDFCNSNVPSAMMDANLKKQFKMLTEDQKAAESDSEMSMKLPSGITVNTVKLKSPLTGMTMIVTQHPTLPDSVNDFWKMIQEMKCSAIVTMQTKEKNCSAWHPTSDNSVILPDGQQVMNIQSTSMARCGDVTVTELCVTSDIGEYQNIKPAEPEQEQGFYANVNQDNKIAPADYGIRCYSLKCLSPDSICETWRETYSSGKCQGESIVIMCGDGHSESGAVATSYMLIDDINKYHQVDVYETVKRTRKYMQKFIKDEAQYELLYKVVERAVKSGSDNSQ